MDINQKLLKRTLSPSYIESLVESWEFVADSGGYRLKIDYTNGMRFIHECPEDSLSKAPAEIKDMLLRDAISSLVSHERYLMVSLNQLRGPIPISEWNILDYEAAGFAPTEIPEDPGDKLDLVLEEIEVPPSDLSESNVVKFINRLVRARVNTPTALSRVNLSSKEIKS